MTVENKVSVFSTNDFNGELEAFKAMKVRVEKTSKVIAAPVEGGAMAFDNKVRMPIRLTISGYVDCSDIFNGAVRRTLTQLNKMFLNRDFEFYSVATRDGAYDNLILQDCPHEENADKLDLAYFELVFVEALIVQGSQNSVKNLDDEDTINLGYLSPESIGRI